jgi:hypothetical protein
VQYRRHSKGLASLFAPHLHRALPHAFDLSFSPSRSLLLPLTLYSTLRDNKKRKKITLLAPAGAQALGSFLNLLNRTTRAFVLLAADEIRNPNPENERKILKTKLSLLTQFAIDNNTLPRSGAHKQDTETRSKLQSIDGSISRKSQTRKASRLGYQLPSFVCLQTGFARGKGAARDETKTYGLVREYVLYTVHTFVKLHTYRIAYYTYENTTI